MQKLFLTLCLSLLSGCTYSITMVHTEGTATDVVDTEQTPRTDISPQVTIPASLIP